MFAVDTNCTLRGGRYNPLLRGLDSLKKVHFPSRNFLHTLLFLIRENRLLTKEVSLYDQRFISLFSKLLFHLALPLLVWEWKTFP